MRPFLTWKSALLLYIIKPCWLTTPHVHFMYALSSAKNCHCSAGNPLRGHPYGSASSGYVAGVMLCQHSSHWPFPWADYNLLFSGVETATWFLETEGSLPQTVINMVILVMTGRSHFFKKAITSYNYQVGSVWEPCFRAEALPRGVTSDLQPKDGQLLQVHQGPGCWYPNMVPSMGPNMNNHIKCRQNSRIEVVSWLITLLSQGRNS